MSNDLIVQTDGDVTPAGRQILRSLFSEDLNDLQVDAFLAFCKSKGLDPFGRQCYPMMRQGKLSFQMAVDGFRSIAEETGELDGQETFWCGADGVWLDVWLPREYPSAAKVLVYRKGCSKPFTGIAKWVEYYPGDTLGFMWRKMSSNQLAKCAEVLGLRKAFPSRLSGIYAPEEMDQADKPVQKATPGGDARAAILKGLVETGDEAESSSGWGSSYSNALKENQVIDADKLTGEVVDDGRDDFADNEPVAQATREPFKPASEAQINRLTEWHGTQGLRLLLQEKFQIQSLDALSMKQAGALVGEVHVAMSAKLKEDFQKIWRKAQLKRPTVKNFAKALQLDEEVVFNLYKASSDGIINVAAVKVSDEHLQKLIDFAEKHIKENPPASIADAPLAALMADDEEPKESYQDRTDRLARGE
jgi:phage recombination protein Bet